MIARSRWRNGHGGCPGTFVLIALASLGCSAGSGELDSLSQPVIYGQDDRKDLHAVQDGAVRELALRSTLARIPAAALMLSRHGEVVLDATTLGERSSLCPGEAFTEQPALADCSGTLVASDLLITAAHCTSGAQPCESQIWAARYALIEESGPVQLEAADLYRCRSVPLRQYQVMPGGSVLDYALVQLDRPITGALRATAVAREALATDDVVTVIGHPSGLPVKVELAAKVVDARLTQGDYFTLRSDTFIGSSGSGVFDRRGELVGTLVRGGIDYEYDAEQACFRARRVPEGQPDRGEEASYVAAAMAALCDSGWKDPTRCGGLSVCGDGQCSVDEHEPRCATDCAPIAIFESQSSRSGCSVARASGACPKGCGAMALLLIALFFRRSRAAPALRRHSQSSAPASPARGLQLCH